MPEDNNDVSTDRISCGIQSLETIIKTPESVF